LLSFQSKIGLKTLPLISVVSPVYKAEECIEELCNKIKLAVEPLTQDFEIILVDDRSPDQSWSVIQTEAFKDQRVIGIRLSRNFGQHRAITAGLDVARGDWVVVMDCDLQDPPEQIPFLYAKAIEGSEIVIAEFEERQESVFAQWVSNLFWTSLSWLAGISFDPKVGNFRIMSKRVVENFRCYREQSRLLGGITSLMGFTTSTIVVKRKERFAGETSYTFIKKLSAALDITIAYSDKPLKISVVGGLAISGISVIIGSIILLLKFVGLIEVSGWAGVMFSLYLLGGLIIANLGVIGYYLSKTFDETKRRPLYIVETVTQDISI
jgi:dolichol-phosphate mannosyltransferase